MPAAGRVRVCQFIDQRHGRPPGEHRVEVHFLQHHAPVLDLPTGHLVQIADQRRRVCSPVRLHDPDHHIDTLPLQSVALLKHLVSFADTGGEAEIELEPAVLLLADERQEVFRPRTGCVGGHGNVDVGWSIPVVAPVGDGLAGRQRAGRLDVDRERFGRDQR